MKGFNAWHCPVHGFFDPTQEHASEIRGSDLTSLLLDMNDRLRKGTLSRRCHAPA